MLTQIKTLEEQQQREALQKEQLASQAEEIARLHDKYLNNVIRTADDNLTLKINTKEPSFITASFLDFIMLFKITPHISTYTTMMVYDINGNILASTVPVVPTPNVFRLYPTIEKYIGVKGRFELLPDNNNKDIMKLALLIYNDE